MFFTDLIELILFKKNLEYFDLSILSIGVHPLNNNKEMPIWEQLFLTLSEYSSHSIKYLKLKGSFLESTDLNFLSHCSNLEELHLDYFIFDINQMKSLKEIYFPKLFSLSLLNCMMVLCDWYDKWLPLILDFLKNHGSTLKELMFVLNKSIYRLMDMNQFSIPYLSTVLILYCSG